MSWFYEVTSGRTFSPDGTLLAVGYSGAPGAVNNPDMEQIPFVGPIPRGGWTMGDLYHDPKTGPNTIPLTPDPNTNTYGRYEFKIHGDSIEFAGQQKASEGCIVLEPLEARLTLGRSFDRHLEVVDVYSDSAT